jgi:mono/diheme cytochrome c family protein
LCADADAPMGQLHALWTLEGLAAVTANALASASVSKDAKVRAHVVRIAEKAGDFAAVKKIAWSANSADEQLQLAFSLGRFPGAEPLSLLIDVLKSHAADDLYCDAAVSGLRDREQEMLAAIQSAGEEKDLEKVVSLLKLSNDVAKTKDLPELKLGKDEQVLYDAGQKVYESFCIGCHGPKGEGIVPLAPPVAESEWVTGSPDRLAAIILNGAQGPITVGGEKYDAPEIQPLMPGLRENPLFDDAQLAGVMTYVRNNFGNRASVVHPDVVKKAREKFANAGIFTEASLKKIR